MIFKQGVAVLSYSGTDPQPAINYAKSMGWSVVDVKIIKEENGITIRTKRDLDVGKECNGKNIEALERDWLHSISK